MQTKLLGDSKAHSISTIYQTSTESLVSQRQQLVWKTRPEDIQQRVTLLEINTGGQTTGMQNKPGASLSIWWLADPEDDYPLKRHSAEVAWPLNGSFDQMLDSPHR